MAILKSAGLWACTNFDLKTETLWHWVITPGWEGLVSVPSPTGLLLRLSQGASKGLQQPFSPELLPFLTLSELSAAFFCAHMCMGVYVCMWMCWQGRLGLGRWWYRGKGRDWIDWGSFNCFLFQSKRKILQFFWAYTNLPPPVFDSFFFPLWYLLASTLPFVHHLQI